MSQNTNTQLADKAIKNPSLLKKLNDKTMILFAIATAKYDEEKAKKLIELRYPDTKPANMVLFWEAVGILKPQPNYS